jgi:FkbM family methyltransferase
LKRIIDSCLGVHPLLSSPVALFRCARALLYKLQIARFRRYCSELQDLLADPMFVKVGANDGVTGDPCSDILLAGARWKGLLIEPVPYCLKRLRVNFGDTRRFAIEPIAIGPRTGRSTFYYVDEQAREHIPDLPRWFDQLGSFDKNHILKHLDGRLAPFIVESTVEVRRLSDVLERHRIGVVHLLHIDAEGYDYEVLKTLDFVRHTPWAIFIEHKHLSPRQKTEMVGVLHRQGYRVRDCGGDYFALRAVAT